uniref:Ribosomal protein L14 n=1 Tax=Storeatula sp. CCMP1868 TaxID=195070 RepID=A0A2P1G881_9CRYP|nr:ribosomal protein L14 [Storeatula sp. CCMP1868]AVM81167.1 ribosomal protein L14 [Storeatula sp. CCMP1868]
MIQHKTLLNVSDNSGVKTVRCIKIIKNKNVLVSIFEKKVKANFKKGALSYGIIIRRKNVTKKKNGIFFSFEKNNIVLINSKQCLVGTRFFGPIPAAFRRKKLLKILCLTLTII